MRNMKKVFALVLSVSLVFTMAVPSFAVTDSVNSVPETNTACIGEMPADCQAVIDNIENNINKVLEKMENAINNTLKRIDEIANGEIDTKDILKKSVPVVVGGVTVALLTAAFVKAIKNKKASAESAEGTLYDESGIGSNVGQTLSNLAFGSTIMKLVDKVIDFCSSIFTKIKTGNTYEINYINNQTIVNN